MIDCGPVINACTLMFPHADGHHFKETALDIAFKLCVGFNAVNNDKGIGIRRLPIQIDRYVPFRNTHF